MIVLSRQRNESIVIDEKIVITVVEIRADKVRLGIEAPREMPVNRHETYQMLQVERNSPPLTQTQFGWSLPMQPPAVPVPDSTPATQTTTAQRKIDAQRPLESLTTHLLEVLGDDQFNRIRPLLDQLTECRGITVKP